MTFSIRSLLMLVTVSSVSILAVQHHLRPDLSFCDTGQNNFDGNVLVYGYDEKGFRWGIVFPDDAMDVFELMGTTNGNIVSVDKDVATIMGTHGKSKIRLCDGRIVVIEGGKILSRTDRIDGIRIKKEVFANSAFNATIIAFDIELPTNLGSQVGLDSQ